MHWFHFKLKYANISITSVEITNRCEIGFIFHGSNHSGFIETRWTNWIDLINYWTHNDVNAHITNRKLISIRNTSKCLLQCKYITANSKSLRKLSIFQIQTARQKALRGYRFHGLPIHFGIECRNDWNVQPTLGFRWLNSEYRHTVAGDRISVSNRQMTAVNNFVFTILNGIRDMGLYQSMWTFHFIIIAMISIESNCFSLLDGRNLNFVRLYGLRHYHTSNNSRFT